MRRPHRELSDSRESVGNPGSNSHKIGRSYLWVADVENAASVWGPRIRLKVARLEPGTPHYLATIRAKEFSLEALLDAYGGGVYYVRAFDGRRYVQSFKLYLDPTVPPKG